MIIVFGSINIDQVYQMENHPRPGETVFGQAYIEVPGGKGANQALAARRAGAEVCMIGAVGQDGNQTKALELLKEAGVDLQHVAELPGHPTGSASIWVDQQGENSIVVHSGANMQAKVEQVLDSHLNAANYLLMQMETPASENLSLLKKCDGKGVTRILNLAPYHPIDRETLAHLEYLIVNEGEGQALLKQFDYSLEDIQAGLYELSKQFDLTIILTRGGKDVLAIHKDDQISIEVPSVNVVDTTAAGDCFTGCFCAGLNEGMSQQEALQYAVAGASLSVQQLGAQTSLPSKNAILKQI